MTYRYDRARRRGVKDEAVGMKNRRWVDAMAKAAEEWVAAGLGVELPEDKGVDPGWDLVYRGWRVDVKWTQTLPSSRVYTHLFVPQWKPLRADIYVGVFGQTVEEFDQYAWASGWASRAEVAAAFVGEFPGKARDSSKRPAPLYQIGFDFLHPLVTDGIAIRAGDDRLLADVRPATHNLSRSGE